ncbi:hypothetical protein DY926_00155 [Komagataeibacter melaceti]|uniref:SRP54-type proteins GTP-binding domain-containing protein n=2 Tax=Komagataeibacter melaceti TaxID=2766577 RepID=A0A371Z4Y4_9PROT|nr:hypothetical protein DY926_00155 [Komagataeibacter melaceti]
MQAMAPETEPGHAEQASVDPQGRISTPSTPAGPDAPQPVVKAGTDHTPVPVQDGAVRARQGNSMPERMGQRALNTEAYAAGVELPIRPTVEDVLRWHAIPQALVAALSGGYLANGLDELLSFGTLPIDRPAPLAFGGPSGGGKTLALAKIVARYVMANQGKDVPLPYVVICDQNPGDFEKLAALVKPFRIPVIQVGTPDALVDAVSQRRKGQPLLLDLPGVCVYSPVSMARMMRMVESIGAELTLVLPAGLDAEESADIGAAFAQSGALTMIASRMDQAGRIGGIITAAACGLTLTYGGCSSAVVGGLATLNAPMLARRLLTLPA